MNMDYEKAYKESFEAAKGLHDAGNALTKKQMEIVFPQLAESEDERIRKFLLRLAERCNENSIDFMGEIKKKDVIAYLEKQKEQCWMPTEGEMGVLYKLCYLSNQISDDDDTELTRLYQDLKREYFNGHSFENMFPKQKEPHFTKRNALFDKCVKNCDPETVEEVNKRVDDIMNMPELSAFEQALTNFICDWEDDEERWADNFVKKHGKHILDMAREELQKEQKPVQSDVEREYVRTLKSLISDFLRGKEEVDREYYQQIFDWLDGRHIEQKPVDFPTTDEEVNEFLETHSKVEVPEKYKTPDFVFSKQEYKSYPIISKDTTSVKPAEWSEEDEDMLNSCISSIEEAKENRYAYKETDGDTSYDHEIAWLKLLRNRVGKEFLQPHWKPSEEQMRALLKVVDKARELHYSSNSGYDEYDVLRLLYKQLKEL